MSYFRRYGMGDAITDPCQIDPTIPCGSGGSTPSGPIVATVSPNQVDCSQLAPDSPFRQPGQPCAPPTTSNGGGIMGWFNGLLQPVFNGPAASAPTSTDQGMGDTTKLLLLGGAAAAAYYYFGKKRR